MSEARNSGLSTGAWIAIAIGGAMALLLALGCVFALFFGVSSAAMPLAPSVSPTLTPVAPPAPAQPTNR